MKILILLFCTFFFNACLLNPIIRALLFSEKNNSNLNFLFLAGMTNPTSATELNESTISSNKDITSYSIPSLNLTGNISGDKISLVSDTLTSISSYTANFTTTGQRVTISGVEQISGVTSNFYTSNLTYTVTAADGSTKNYYVSLTAPRSYGGSSLRIWLKADSITAGNGSSVASWTDDSGYGNHFTNVNVPAQPIYQTSRINGLPALNFTQSGVSSLGITTATGLYIDNSASYFIVMKFYTNAGGAQTIFNIGGTDGRQFDMTSSPANVWLGRNNSGWDYFSSFVFPTEFVAFGTVQNLQVSKNEIWNGDLKAELNPASTIDSMYAGNPVNAFLSSGNSDMEVAEFLYFNTFLSQTEVNKVFCYLNTKYNLSSTTINCNNI
ncbi:MAG: hypothetical protein SH817_05160 [Leptospira sp.]|nr:hypothetical protein [Leptospira sp.]